MLMSVLSQRCKCCSNNNLRRTAEDNEQAYKYYLEFNMMSYSINNKLSIGGQTTGQLSFNPAPFLK